LAKGRFYFTTYDLVLIAIMAEAQAVFGIVVSKFGMTLAHGVHFPGGSIVGGLYYVFILLVRGLTGKFGSAVVACELEALIVAVIDPGRMGFLRLISYLPSALAVDLVPLITRDHRLERPVPNLLTGGFGNAVGMLTTLTFYMGLPLGYVLLASGVGFVSGMLLGGLVAWRLAASLRKSGLLNLAG